MVEDRSCNNCGESDWREVVDLEISYPDRRRDRDQTIRKVFVCQSCGFEGRRFEDGLYGTVQYSGSLR